MNQKAHVQPECVNKKQSLKSCLSGGFVNKLPAFLKTKPWPGGKAHKSLKLCKLRGRKMACKQSKEASDAIMLRLHTTAKAMTCPRKQTGSMDPSAKCLLFLFSVATTTTTRSDFDHKTTKS
jgi:hypothetical protein